MSDDYRKKLEDAIVTAHESGDTEGAQMLADEYKRWQPKNEQIDTSPVKDNSFGQNLLIGVGKGMTDVYQGAKQRLGYATPQDVAEKRKLDEAITQTAGGKVGEFAGGAATLSPAMLIPGVNSYAGAAAIGGLSGALSPTTQDESALKNAAFGVAGGVAGQKVGSLLANKIASNVSSAAAAKSMNATRDATLQQSKEVGYKVPRSLYDPTFLTNRLESVAGKAATKQQAALNNQQVTNKLAREYLGLPPDTPLDNASLEALKDTHAQAYRDAAALPAQTNPFSGVGVSSVSNKSGAQLVSDIKDAKDVSRAAWKTFSSGQAQKPNKVLKEAKKADALVKSLEDELDNLAKLNGNPEILDNLRKARTELAKVHTVENALNGSDVSARSIFAQGKKTKITDQAKKIAEFAKFFPQVAQDGTKIPAAGVSKVEALTAALLSGGGGLAFGPSGLAAGGLAAVPHMVRPLAVNGGLPSYGSSVLSALNGKPSQLLPYLGLLGGSVAASQ